LASDWQVYDEAAATYVPYIYDLHFPLRKAHLLLKRQEVEGYTLSLKKEKGYLFINNQLCYNFENQSSSYLDMDSLFRTDTLKIFLLTYYSDQIIYQFPEAFLGRKDNVEALTKKQLLKEELLAKTIAKQPYRNFLIVASILLLLIIAIISHFMKGSVFGFDRESERLSRIGQVKKIGFWQFFSFMLLYSVSIAFTIFFLSTYTESFSMDNITVRKENFWGLNNNFLELTLFIAFFLCLKYMLIWSVGNLLNNKFIANFHFQEYLNINRMMCVSWGIVMILANAAQPSLPSSWVELLVYLSMMVWVLKSLLISIRINGVGTYQKLHLFSYLCTTEYVPTLLLAKIFLKI